MFVPFVLPPWVVVFGLLGAVPFNSNLEVGRLASPLPAPLPPLQASHWAGGGCWHQKPWGGGGRRSERIMNPSKGLTSCQVLAAAQLVQTSVEDGALEKLWLNVELLRHTSHSHIQGCCCIRILHFCPHSEDCRTSLRVWPL